MTPSTEKVFSAVDLSGGGGGGLHFFSSLLSSIKSRTSVDPHLEKEGLVDGGVGSEL